MVYLDNAATTRVCPEAAEAAVHMMTECFGNPSTTYKLGREAKAAVDKARGFSILDFAVFETCLLSLGLWLGTCFSKCFKKLRTLFFVAFAASWLYMLWRVFFDDED